MLHRLVPGDHKCPCFEVRTRCVLVSLLPNDQIDLLQDVWNIVDISGYEGADEAFQVELALCELDYEMIITGNR